MFIRLYPNSFGVGEVEIFWEIFASDKLTFHMAYNLVKNGRSVVIGYDKEAGRARLYRRVRQARKKHSRVFQWMALTKDERKQVIETRENTGIISPLLGRKLEK